jgi:hypothetical protein
MDLDSHGQPRPIPLGPPPLKRVSGHSHYHAVSDAPSLFPWNIIDSVQRRLRRRMRAPKAHIVLGHRARRRASARRSAAEGAWVKKRPGSFTSTSMTWKPSGVSTPSMRA